MSSRTNVTAKRLMDACELLLCEAHALEELTARRIAIRVQATPSRAKLVDILPGARRELRLGLVRNVDIRTRGEPNVTDIVPLGANKETDVLRIAAAVEVGSERPLGEAIIRAVSHRQLVYPVVTGRGNRVNGFVTPCRPMSLEAAAGKNPVTHIGKIYNVLAQRIAATIINTVPGVHAAHCLMVSRIGDPVNRPSVLHVKVATQEGLAVDDIRQQVAGVAENHLDRLPSLIDELADGTIAVF